MSIANKLIYLNTTKEKLKDSINNIGGSITDETTFRAYAEELDNIYSNIPKTTGEGSNLSLTTIKGRINVDDILGNTTQEGTPTPDSPQDINVVTGQQEVLVRTNNLLKPTLQSNGTDFTQVRCSVTLQDDEFTFVASGTDMYIGSVASAGTSYTNNLGYLIELPSNASKIWVTFTNTSFTGSYITWYDENKISLGYGLAHQTGDSVVSGAKYCSIRIGMGNSVSGTTYKTKIMVNVGLTALSYVPYQEQTKIVNLSSKNISIPITYNRGLASGITWAMSGNAITGSGTASGATQSLTTSVATSNNYTFSLPSGTYTLSGGNDKIQLQVLNSSGTTLGTTATDTGKVTFTNNSTQDVYIRGTCSSGVALGTTGVTVYVMLESGSTAQTYEPYYNYELSKIGTYQDKIAKSSGKNLFNKDNANIIDNAYIGSTNITSTNGAKTLYIECEPNTTYTISRTAGKRFVVATTIYEPQLNTSIGGRIVDNEASSITITTNSVAKYLCIFYYLSGTDTLSEETIRNSIMINLGSSSLPYEPYGSDKWYIEKNNIEKDKEYLVAQVGQVDTITDYARIRVYLNNACISTPTGLCSHLKFEASYSGQSNHFYAQGNYAYLIVDKTLLSTIDVTGAKAYLNTLTGLKILYPLVTPTYEEITNETLLQELESLEKLYSYNGVTNITTTSDTGCDIILSVSALKGA